MSSYIILFAFFHVRSVTCDVQRFAFLIMLVETIPDLTDNNCSTTSPLFHAGINGKRFGLDISKPTPILFTQLLIVCVGILLIHGPLRGVGREQGV